MSFFQSLCGKTVMKLLISSLYLFGKSDIVNYKGKLICSTLLVNINESVASEVYMARINNVESVRERLIILLKWVVFDE